MNPPATTTGTTKKIKFCQFAALLVFFSIFATVAGRVFLKPETQNDFLTIYAATKAHAKGLNPYDLTVLSNSMPIPVVNPYVYPPYTLYVFHPFSLLDFSTAARLFLVMKLACLAALVWIWDRLVNLRQQGGVLLLLITFAFNGTILIDLMCGNISIFEQLLIWGGLYWYTRRKPVAFGAAIVLAAAFKLVPILLLSLLATRWQKSRIAIGALFGACLAIMLGGSCLAWPDLFGEFLRNARGLDVEHGEVNPSTWPLIRGISSHLSHFAGRAPSNVAPLALYGLLAVAVLAVGIWLFLRLKDRDDAQAEMWRISLLCLMYAVTIPRFKSYSYILLLAPTCFVLTAPPKLEALAPWVLALIVGRVARDYYSLFLAWSLLVLCGYKVWKATKPTLAETPPGPASLATRAT